jgi:hypothetical protein
VASLSRITATFFVSLINRLGIRPPPAEGFQISNVVQPVSIVDSDISIPAVLTSILLDQNVFTQGELTSPAAGLLAADTGAQPAGTYLCYIILSQDVAITSSCSYRLQRRDAANAATIWGQLLSTGSTGSNYFAQGVFIRLLLNERLRLLVDNATNLGVYQASIWLQLVTAG